MQDYKEIDDLYATKICHFLVLILKYAILDQF